MSRNTGDGRKTEIGEAGSPVLVDQDVRLFMLVTGVRFFVWRNTYPLEVSVNYTEAMHIHQAIRDVNQLNSTSVRRSRE